MARGAICDVLVSVRATGKVQWPFRPATVTVWQLTSKGIASSSAWTRVRMAGRSAAGSASRTTLFSVLLSAFYVLAHEITGVTDLTIRALTTGRDEPQFQDTMGLFINLVPFQTDVSGCVSFRDVVAHTKEAFIDAIAHELPFGVIADIP